jgi:hypothetical protein
LRDELEPLKEKFLFNQDELPKALKAFADAGVEIGIILHHEYPVVDKNIPAGFKKEQAIENARRQLAVNCVKFCDAERKKNPKIPPIHVIMVLTELPEPSALMRPIDPKPTQLVEIGHKGKYVGLLGVYRAGKAYRLQYQMVLMSPEWQTKKGQEKNNAVTALMEDYNQQLKRQDMLAKFPRSTHRNQNQPQGQKGLKATYLGSEQCSRCHAEAYAAWEKTPHFYATKTLEKAEHPSGRQYDPECMMCHTTGFKHPGGYYDLVTKLADWPPKPNDPKPDPKKFQKHNINLRGVGCESCHGPCSEHEKNPNNAKLYDLINPYRLSKEERGLEEKAEKKSIKPKEKARLDQLFSARMRLMGPKLCMKCHDSENDVNWGQPGKDTADKWKGGKHPLIHRKPTNNHGAGDPPPAKGNNPPAVVNDPAPPIVIEIIQDKKK